MFFSYDLIKIYLLFKKLYSIILVLILYQMKKKCFINISSSFEQSSNHQVFIEH